MIAAKAFTLKLAMLLSMGQFTPAHIRPIEVGAFGYPALVDDEAGNAATPIKLYEDNSVATFVPDFTSEGALQTKGQAFQQTGRYNLVLYTFYKNDKSCLGMLKPEQRTNPEMIEACGNFRYRMENATVDTRAGTTVTLIVMILGPGGRVFSDSIQQRGASPSETIASRNIQTRESVRTMTALMHKLTDERKFARP